MDKEQDQRESRQLRRRHSVIDAEGIDDAQRRDGKVIDQACRNQAFLLQPVRMEQTVGTENDAHRRREADQINPPVVFRVHDRHDIAAKRKKQEQKKNRKDPFQAFPFPVSCCENKNNRREHRHGKVQVGPVPGGFQRADQVNGPGKVSPEVFIVEQIPAVRKTRGTVGMEITVQSSKAEHMIHS